LVKKKLLKEKKRVKKIKYRVKKLNFDEIIKDFREYFSKIPDSRRMPQYPIEDIVISVFAMMFFQDPSMLTFQNRMKERLNKNNLETLFRVKNIPSDGTIRNVLDKIDPSFLEDAFFIIFRSLERSGVLKEFLSIDDSYTIAIDGTQYFTSYNCSCDKCLTTKKKGKDIRYHHNVLQLSLVDADQKHIIPLLSEEIVNDPDNDKYDKQDSEHKAAKRALRRLRKHLPNLKITILGDDLYGHEPIVNLCEELNLSYVFTCKKTSHISMFQYMNDDKESFQSIRRNNSIWIMKKTMIARLKYIGKEEKDLPKPQYKNRYYKQINNFNYKYYDEEVPVNANHKTFCNYFELEITDELTTKRSFFSSWITNIKVDASNIKRLAKIGRSRWKIENEQFKTTKKGGYNLEHNYGHGENNLSYNFYVLNVLAFLIHQILHITCPDFNDLKDKAGGYRMLYDNLKSVIKYFVFDTFDQLLIFELNEDTG